MTQVLLNSTRPCFIASSEQPGRQALPVSSDRLRKLRLGQDQGLAQGHRARRCRRRVETQFAWLLCPVCERMLEISLGPGTAAMCSQTVSVSGRAAEEFG